MIRPVLARRLRVSFTPNSPWDQLFFVSPWYQSAIDNGRAMAENQDPNVPMRVMHDRKRVALIAHDNRKADLLQWARVNREVLAGHDLFATGTTGGILADELDLDITRFKSGPLGGDQQIGARIAEGEIDLVIFFWDPLQTQPHDVDVKALLRIAVVYNIPMACNRSTADFLISSPLMSGPYESPIIDYEHRIHPENTLEGG